MSFAIELYAQALDNKSPDHFESGGVLLPARDPRCGKILDRCSAINLEGKPAGDAALDMKRRKAEFLLRVTAPAKDSAGRLSPVLCVGVLPASSDRVPAWAEEVVEAVGRFCASAGRPIDVVDLALLGQRMREVELAHLKKKRAVVAAASLVAFFMLATAFLMSWARC